ncbi:ABC transporter ATP-binding protein [Lacticaseibacillus paracasei]|uniref:amino acid ABC transporter ATP-binding/permease protein n=1 Tax=Lacticaseibacillus paracasei TaxID=1597 RepID=UPI000EB4E3B0|nr:ABC transporter ATP-binding protein [Lacticaseibacillus paracasei]RKW79904.1 ABC transporter ATP-binding protein [Lacticaseibacillus paracasei]
MIRSLLRYTHHLTGAIIISFLIGLVAELTKVVVLVLAAMMLFDPQNASHLLIPGIIAVVIVGLGSFGEQYAGHFVAFHVLAELRGAVYRKLVQLAPAKLDSQGSGKLLKLIGSDIEAMEIFYAHTIVPVAIGLIYGVLMVAVYSSLNGPAAAVVLVSYAAVGLLIPYYRHEQMTAKAQAADRQKAVNQQYLLESVRGMAVLRQLEVADARMKTGNKGFDHEATAFQQSQFGQLLKNMSATLVMLVAWLFIVWLSGWTQPQPLQQALLAVFPLTFGPLLALTNLPASLLNGFAAARNLLNLLQEVPATSAAIDATRTLNQIAIIQVDHVTFKYPSRDETVLRQVSLSLHAGEIVGFVGASGSGKSTLAKLIMGWYPLTQGRILIDGIDLTKIDPASLRAQVNYLPQTPVFFSESVRDNLTLHDATITDAQIWTVLNQVKLTSRLRQAEKGLDENVVSGQLQFSSGEQQRLELARALLHPSSVLVLDEPTSNLDTENERLILDAIKAYYHGIVIMISHRAESAAYADRLYRFADHQVSAASTEPK